jgi:hypothetical protein
MITLPSFPVTYDFSNKDPSAILTEDELEHFDEGMEIKGGSVRDFYIDFGRAVKATVADLDNLLA